MMIIGKWVPVLTGIAAIGLAISSALAGIQPEHSPAGRGGPTQTCANSTRSIRQLAMIDHTSDGGFQCLGVFVEGDTVKAIRLERHSFADVAGHPEPEQVKVAEFPPTTVDSLRGAVIDGVPGHDAIVLRGHFSTPPGTGKLEISYLYNGLTGEFHSCRIGLDRTPNAGWRLVNRFDQTISLIGVRVRQLPMVGVIGIAILEGACT
jgi:hypothetical protein